MTQRFDDKKCYGGIFGCVDLSLIIPFIILFYILPNLVNVVNQVEGTIIITLTIILGPLTSVTLTNIQPFKKLIEQTES